MTAISIIMPVYNGEKFLAVSLSKITEQNFKDWELICVNDGSTDGSAVILDSFAEKDSRIRVFHNENKGPGMALNYGVAKAGGDYLCFMDQDDFAAEDWLEKLYHAVTSHQTEAALCYAYYFRDDQTAPEKINYPDFASGCYDLSSEQMKQKMCLSFLPQWLKIVRRSFWLKHKLSFPDKHNWLHDVPVSFFLFHFADKIAIINEPLYYHRVHAGQITYDLTNAQKINNGFLETMEDIIDKCRTDKLDFETITKRAVKFLKLVVNNQPTPEQKERINSIMKECNLQTTAIYGSYWKRLRHFVFQCRKKEGGIFLKIFGLTIQGK